VARTLVVLGEKLFYIY